MFDPEFITNPYKTYSYLRAGSPLFWAAKFRTGAWLVPRYADVLAGLHDSRLSSQRSHTLTAALPTEAQSEFATFNQIFSKWMLFLDPPQHSRLRKLLNKEFTPNMIQRMRPRHQEIKKGQTVILVLGSANRDPDKFSNPERLEISRDEGMPLSFGHGIHFCIGQALAYTEAEIGFSTLLQRTSGLRLLDDVPSWRPIMGFRGLTKLPLALSVH